MWRRFSRSLCWTGEASHEPPNSRLQRTSARHALTMSSQSARGPKTLNRRPSDAFRRMTEPTALHDLYQSDHSPFPYEACRAVLALSPGELDGLIPDLDMFFFRIAGYASVVNKVDSWSASRVTQARADLANSFFEEHPEYELLQRDITDELAPDLAEQLRFHEHLRVEILKLARERERI